MLAQGSLWYFNLGIVSYTTKGKQFDVGTGLCQGMGFMDGCPGKMTGVMGKRANK